MLIWWDESDRRFPFLFLSRFEGVRAVISELGTRSEARLDVTLGSFVITAGSLGRQRGVRLVRAVAQRMTNIY